MTEPRGCENCRHLGTPGFEEPCLTCLTKSWHGVWHPMFDPYEEEKRMDLIGDGRRCEDICKYASPETKKWPCVDCDMRWHDRAEPPEEET